MRHHRDVNGAERLVHHREEAGTGRQSGRRGRALLITVALVAVIVTVVGLLSMLSYWIVTTVERWLHTSSGVWEQQIFVVLLSIMLLVLAGVIVSRFTVPRQVVFWRSLIAAFQQMSQANFDINLDFGNQYLNDRRVGELVDSIHDMAEGLGRLEQMRQEFIANVSHEIQSPLTSIRGFVHILKNEVMTEESRLHYLQIIETESTRLSRLSDNLLKLTALESKSYPIRLETFRLDRQLRQVVLAMEPQWAQKDIQWDIDLPNFSIVADEDLIRQVWSNLLHNAIKFTPVNGSIGLRLHRREGQTSVDIWDTGVGMDAQDSARIFERFFKADRAHNRDIAGSGLGLAIVKQIVDLHGGTIEVSSRVGAGTRFRICLPWQDA